MAKPILPRRRAGKPKLTERPRTAPMACIDDALRLIDLARALADMMTAVTAEMLDDATIPNVGSALDDILAHTVARLREATEVRP